MKTQESLETQKHGKQLDIDCLWWINGMRSYNLHGMLSLLQSIVIYIAWLAIKNKLLSIERKIY